MKKLIIPIIFIIIFSSCSREDEEIMPRWPFKFVAVNDGSKGLITVYLRVSISYPLENYTHLLGTHKSVYRPYYDEYTLHEFDSVKISSPENVYQRCIVRMSVTTDVLSDPKDSRFTLYKTDTIRTYKDSSMVVIWPRDSALFTKEEN